MYFLLNSDAYRSNPWEVFLGKGVLENIQQVYRKTLMPKCGFTKGGFWACAFLFLYSLAGEIFFFKIVKMDLTFNQFMTKRFATIFRPIKTQIDFNLCFISKYISIRSNRRWLLIIWIISTYLQMFFQLKCYCNRAIYINYNN